MFTNALNSILFFGLISTHVLGRAVPQGGSSYEEHYNLQAILTEYSDEIAIQDQAIEGLQYQLELQDKASVELISSLSTELIESYYRQMEPRNRMVEIVPRDTVLDSNSFEYLVAVGSRYANNVMHLARQIKRDPLDQESSASALRDLKKEHEKIQMFDQLLLGLADVTKSQEEDTEEGIAPFGSNSQSVLNDDEPHSTEVITLAEDKDMEDSDSGSVSVTVEEETLTRTTEIVVTSYKETVVGW
ncbi:hypothetical protein MJO28_003855 [Puccinia striiformis f. sp. tritici]|uniref:Uncharacterized protein n=3 Tax=Puccinia striiformis TaxID=27350 RepID=A0A2S4VJL7_9BASI|nr:hypothetical protein Pst134EB_008638 [Puccinia striiformis f. sp. tritici]KAI7956760.1 hypothetical protein MJO28_003855 [Puccinia striiformis f. sp. tritici]KAI9611129.1 hypothetical protein H4Q26_008979 [Puccinia striiformis f. sp. tritici PST-130]POV95474.1 hypothetical protein PSHT_15641 [Puccinia striiformis]POW09638.1 hypothetical protein PSTT_06656 [Puccinia striiformis]